MASNISSTAEGSSQKTPAQLMMETHAAAETHNPTVEEVVDEEDIVHPPPSAQQSNTAVPATNGHTDGLMSEKAAGKRRADNKTSALDTQSEEAFPSLGAGPKPSASTKAPGWGPKGPLKSASPAPSPTPGRPGSATAARGVTPAVSLPGKFRDSFEIANADIDKSKPVERVLQDVRRKFKVNAYSEDAGFATKRRFVAEGPRAQVSEALRYISKEVSVEQQLKIEVPATVSASIIGKGGANIRHLEKEYGVKIHINRDQGAPSTGPEDPRIDVVEIRGDAAATRLAHEKVASMVKQLQPKVDLPIRNIPPEFYPFIRGRHSDQLEKMEQDRDLRIQVPQFHTWVQQPPPRPAREGAPPTYVPHGDSHIVVSGDQAAVVQARQFLEQLAQRLQQELILSELACEQILHPYIVGERGMDPLKFMEETGCAVILPPPHHETEDIHIIGPANRIEAGKDLATKLMAQRHNRTVDLQKQFADAPMGAERHSRALARYLQQKAIEREFMDNHGAELVFPTQPNSAHTWSVITSDPQKAITARNDLSKIAQAFPASRLNLVQIDPFFHPYLESIHADSLRQQHGVHMIVPDDDEEPVMLIYEGPVDKGPFSVPRARPTGSEIQEFERALQQAQAQLVGSIPQQGISVENMEIPRKFHDRVRRFVRSEQQPQTPTYFPVQLAFEAPAAPKARKAAGGNSDNAFLSGPSESDIADLRQKIVEFLIEAEQDEKERGYVTTFDFPANFTKNLIGKQGANIKVLREKHDVDIDTRETGKIKIQGPQKKAEACKAEIIKLGKQFEDEVNYVIKVDPKFHGELIGKSGENLHRLQEKVNNEVRIDFPRVAKGGDEASGRDGGSEVGGPTRQAADEIKIRGPRAKADKVRDELLSLHQYLLDNSHTATVSVAREQIASLIGRGGAEMEKLRVETGAQIDVPNRQGEGDGNRVTLTVKGSKQQVDKAKAELQKRAKEFDSVVTKTIEVDRKHHRTLIGGSGANIRRIVVDAGGPDQSAEAVRFPRQGEESNELTIKGTQDVVDKIVASIQSFVDEKENSVSEIIDVPTDQHRNLIGPNGITRRELEERFKVSLDVPRRDSGKTGVKIAGQPSAVAAAKGHISGMTKRPEGVTIQVPRSVHHNVAKNGLLFRELSRDGVKIDHGGQKPPPKPQAEGPQRARNGDTPLITDQQDESSHSWDIVQSGGASNGEEGTIPWVILGNSNVGEDVLAKVRKNIEAAIERAQTPKHTGYLILPDPRLHRHVIGRGGATINRIRKSTGCDIQVPKNNAGQGEEGEAITIVGDEAGVLNARDLILEEIKKASE